MTFPSLAVLALHILSFIQPSIVWGVWAQGWSCMTRDGLWSLGGLRCEDWLITLWDCHLFFHEYRDWSCMMRVGLWWAVMLDEIVVYFALRGLSLRLLWSIQSTVWCTILEGWCGYIIWALIFSIDHLRVENIMLEIVVVGWVAFISVSDSSLLQSCHLILAQTSVINKIYKT